MDERLQLRQQPRHKRADAHHEREDEQQPAEARRIGIVGVQRVGRVADDPGLLLEEDYLDEDGAEFAGGGRDTMAGAAVAGREDLRGDLGDDFSV